jgi:hypothetical protein
MVEKGGDLARISRSFSGERPVQLQYGILFTPEAGDIYWHAQQIIFVARTHDRVLP